MAAEHRRPNLKDVAARAGTSIATASRVLNNTGYIADETRARVLRAAQQLHYQPNLRAQGLRRGSSRTVGILIPSLLNAYYTALADSISLLLAGSGYQMLLSSSRDDPAVEAEALAGMVGHDVDGLIWVPTATDLELVRFLQLQKTPAVSIIRRLPDSPIDSIVFEDFPGSQAATRHLLELGHRRIGFIGGDTHFSSNHDRWQGYLATLRENGIAEEAQLIRLGSTHSAWGEAAAGELLALENPPTALYAASNAIMAGVLKCLHQRRVQVPEQLSLICFDDLDWFTYSTPPISAVSTSHERIAQAAVELLMRRIQGPADQEDPAVQEEPPDQRDPAPARIEVAFDLVVRGSTAPPGKLSA